jgi:glycosyltransferase involved in cell wall biosynthesis
VITRENSGSAWLIGDGGLVFKNGNYKDLCNKILELCDNIELRREMGLKALERAKYFDYKKWADELKKIIVKLEQ